MPDPSILLPILSSPRGLLSSPRTRQAALHEHIRAKRRTTEPHSHPISNILQEEMEVVLNVKKATHPPFVWNNVW